MAEVQQAKGSTPSRPIASVAMCVNPTTNLSTWGGRHRHKRTRRGSGASGTRVQGCVGKQAAVEA